jgi:tryptophan-rich sensory protein
VQVPDALVIAWLALLVVGGRSAVRVWSSRHRHRSTHDEQPLGR